MGFKHLTIYAALLAVDPTIASHTLVRRAAHSIHQKAIWHTHNLAQDLRLAFGTMLVSRASVDQSDHVVYCKSGSQAPFSNSGGNATSSASPTESTGQATSTKSGSSPTSTTTSAASPWNLVESHVGYLVFAVICFIERACRKDRISSMNGLFLLVRILRMVSWSFLSQYHSILSSRVRHCHLHRSKHCGTSYYFWL